VVVVIIGVLGAVYAVRSHGAAADEGRIAAAQVDSAPAQPATGSQQASVTLTAFVPAETFVHVDDDGRPVEAMTNTGVRPAPGDRFFVETHGSVRPAEQAVVTSVLRLSAGSAPGDWARPGRWNALD
jgi:hypothetical protein